MRGEKVNGTTATKPDDEWVPLSSLTHWARNPRRNDDAVDGVARSIIAFGWGSPILARSEDRRIIAGHTRAKAAARLPALWRRQSSREREDWHPDAVRTKDTAEVVVRWKAGLTDAQCDALAVADNKLGEKADWDKDLLADVLDGLPDPSLCGFDDGELLRLCGADEDVEVSEVDVSESRVEFWLTVTGDITDQPEVLERLREVLAGIPAVEVTITSSERP
jgi:hypothetical protein